MRRLLICSFAAFAAFASPAIAADTQQVVAVCGTPTGLTYPVPGLGNVTINTSGLLCITGTLAASSQYPAGAIPITGNANGTTGAVVGTLAAVAGKTTYICGFTVSGFGGTGDPGPVTVAGTTGSSMTFQMSLNNASTSSVLQQNFSPCVPASAANTAITITTTAAAGATAVNVVSFGYQL
jgi:hypothetical protein